MEIHLKRLPEAFFHHHTNVDPNGIANFYPCTFLSERFRRFFVVVVVAVITHHYENQKSYEIDS